MGKSTNREILRKGGSPVTFSGKAGCPTWLGKEKQQSSSNSRKFVTLHLRPGADIYMCHGTCHYRGAQHLFVKLHTGDPGSVGS